MQLKSLLRDACYINGQWVQADSKESFAVTNPFNGSVIGLVPECGTAETRRAISAAHSAWPLWREKTAKERAAYLRQFAYLIDENKESLAELLTREQGKPLVEARGEIDYANSFIKWCAEEALRIYGDIIPANNNGQHLLVLKQSVGVAALITPWNFPAAMITRKLAPALAVGCTVVIKPAAETPLTALALAALAEQAGLPAGVINVVTGSPKEIGLELTSNPLVRKLSFTGSTAVGKLLMQQCSSTVKKISLELGGNAPFIVFNDADIDAAVQGAMVSKFRNTGQTCVCANRIYVQDNVYDEFITKFSAAIKTLTLGDGLVSGVTQGPLINAAALSKVTAHVNDAVQKGARIICGGKQLAVGGLFFEPTLLVDVTHSMRVAEEETFGPIAAVIRFVEDADVIQMANNTDAGLASYFYSRDISRIWRVAEALEYGMVGVNTGLISTEVAPFGGFKQSGIGREGSKYGMDEYLELKYVCMNTA
jgi:succinate-semialdehyde dehydrogenase/glutarate-semialdehyde dehydrogenase